MLKGLPPCTGGPQDRWCPFRGSFLGTRTCCGPDLQMRRWKLGEYPVSSPDSHPIRREQAGPSRLAIGSTGKAWVGAEMGNQS